ncbi:Thylakoid lumenal protein TL20.3, chloroplastic [Vitis vinifera]|uniref:Thylakoid lumenal protein TL20.3, chloroplastic n=1 Tax=Vitis vinifera TaxID=29760 RepID=A0A438K3A1_VITVI|nr:Thylakoid lumenal protein TL20.3, chloroplastic [Vitis vinifera]
MDGEVLLILLLLAELELKLLPEDLSPPISFSRPYKMVLHPSTGLCVLRGSLSEPLKLGPCTESEAWGYTPQKILIIKGTYLCLQAVGLGKPAKLSVICSNPGSNWESISDSKMYLSTKLGNGTAVCLDVDSSDDIVTNSCKCLSRDDMCDPGSQWEANAESKKWQRLVSTALAAAVVTLSPVMPAVADLNKYEAETRGEFGIGSAAQFGSADLRKAVHVNENFRRANFTSADMRESDFSGSTFNGAYLEKAVAYKANFTVAPRLSVVDFPTLLAFLHGQFGAAIKASTTTCP